MLYSDNKVGREIERDGRAMLLEVHTPTVIQPHVARMNIACSNAFF